MSDQSRYTVTLLNQQLVLVSNQTQEVVASVCEVVDAIMCDISTKNPLASKSSIAMLAAIRLAEELLLLEKTVQAMVDKVDNVSH